MEQSNEVLSDTAVMRTAVVPQPSLEVRLAVMEERLNTVRKDVKELDNRLTESVARIEHMIDGLKNRPNSVQEFLEENWKAIVLVVMGVLGANATIVETLAKAFFGS